METSDAIAAALRHLDELVELAFAASRSAEDENVDSLVIAQTRDLANGLDHFSSTLRAALLAKPA